MKLQVESKFAPRVLTIETKKEYLLFLRLIQCAARTVAPGEEMETLALEIKRMLEEVP